MKYTTSPSLRMERLTDAFQETHNITLSEEDTPFGGLDSNLQVAELMAVMAKNRRLAYCKVVEVITETMAPLTPIEELLEKIPSQRPEPNVQDAACWRKGYCEQCNLWHRRWVPMDRLISYMITSNHLRRLV